MLRKAFLTLSVAAIVTMLGSATLCHSKEFWLAKGKLGKMVLTPAQKAEIAQYEKSFKTKWNRTHRLRGCKYHEAHVDEFIAAAAGVLNDEQFRSFRGRKRNDVETVGYDIRQTGQHIENLLKIAESL